jgi:hypothetical protein
MDRLDCSYLDRKDENRPALARTLANELWDLELTAHSREAGLCLQYYDSLSATLDFALYAPRTHRNVLDVVKHLHGGLTKPLELLATELKDPIRSVLKTGMSGPESTEYALRFAASLWLFMDTSEWMKQESLNAFVSRSVPMPSQVPGAAPPTGRLHVNARSLVQIAGIEIVWTSNVADHLRLDLVNPRTPQLFCFRHGCFLGTMESPSSAGTCPSKLLHPSPQLLTLATIDSMQMSSLTDSYVRRQRH